MDAAVLTSRETLEVTEVVVANILIAMVDLPPVRDRAALSLPYRSM